MHLLRPAQGRAAKLNIARVRNSRAMSTSDTTPELAPPSVQVITPLPYDPWRLGRLSRSQAWENAKTALPIHVGHAAGCKVCYYGKDPCPICMYVLPCEDLVPGCFMPIPCCFGVHNHMVEILYGCSIGTKSPYPSQTFSYSHSPRIVYTTYVLVAARNPGAGIRGHSETRKKAETQAKRVSA